MSDLKPCPFCGSTKMKVDSKRGTIRLGKQRVSVSVRCNSCNARGPVVGITMDAGRYNERELVGEEVFEMWNRRM